LEGDARSAPVRWARYPEFARLAIAFETSAQKDSALRSSPLAAPVGLEAVAPTGPRQAASDQSPRGVTVQPPQLRLLHVFWVLMVFELDQFLAVKTGLPFYVLPTLLAPVLFFHTLSYGRRRALYWPIMLFLAMHLGAALLAPNAGLARPPFKFIAYMTLLLASTASFVDSPRRMTYLLKLYLLSFAWYAVQGVIHGKVPWHHLLSNEDSFGPLMVIAMPFAFFFAQATSSKRWRWVALGVFALSILGLITSFARGAGLAGAVALCYIFLFSSNKIRTIAYLIGAAVVAVPIAGALLPLDAYVKEIKSSAGGDEGRMIIWNMAWRVFKTNPVIGVGAGNNGVVAQRIATPEEAEAMWSGYYFLAVHNTPIEILSEEGLVGLVIWGTMIVGFFRWNARLRRKDARENWAGCGGAELDLREVSRGLDGSMLGYLTSSLFYNQLYIHWFWSLLTISYALHLLVRPAAVPVVRGRWRRQNSPVLSRQRS
jgi:O-antigen ligase